ncbi:MAG: adenylate/guanylate cyclase domain-containing protein [Spirochaetes bacterium]|nr:adenylate/guanylate cyclase domain-containing protein [Spirochaetota bacterium]
MSIRIKLILVVLPIIIIAVVLAGMSSYFIASGAVNRVTTELLSFKSLELEKYAESQWNLLVESGMTDRPDMVEAASRGVESFGRTIVTSETEVVFATDASGALTIRTTAIEMGESERARIAESYKKGERGIIEIPIGGTMRVAATFPFGPFGWQVFVAEQKSVFFSDIEQITRQTTYILGASAVAAVIMLLFLVNLLTRPLMNVVGAMKKIIESNDLSEKVDVEYKDEIGKLSHTFNLMLGELDKAYKQIKRYAFDAVLAQKKETRIRNIFQKYVPRELIEQFFKNPEGMLVGENRDLAVLFSDIRGFTTISESMRPDDLVNSLNRYFTSMVDIIMAKNGIIDKYIGDAIMAFFGAPVRHDDDALNSLLAGLDMITALDDFNATQEKLGKPLFHIGVGINFGTVTVGNIGCEKKMDYTVIGDTVNLASRLEGQTKEYHQKLILAENLHELVKNEIPCRLIDSIAVKGKTKGVRIYTSKRSLGDRESEAWTLHNTAMDGYFKRDFTSGLAKFERVSSLLGPDDYASAMMVERCRAFVANPPPADWDGVEVKHEK